MFDKEIEAIAKCSELIQDLEDDAKMRVIKYLIERYWIWLNRSASLVQNDFVPNSSWMLTPVISDYTENTDIEYPNLKDLVMKDAPKNESEWTLIYWFYSSNFWTKHFSREDIILKYEETKRKTDTKIKNLSQSIKTWISKDWYKSVNDKEFIILESWKKYAIEIINWNSQWSSRKRIKKASNKV